MANVTVNSLIPYVRVRVGDSKNEEYTDSELGDFIEQGGVMAYNGEMPDELTILGSGSSRYFSPLPTQEQQRLLVLFSARCALEDAAIQNAKVAISFSNPISNIDLKQVSRMLSEQIEKITNEIDKIRKHIVQRNIVGDSKMERLTQSGAKKEISWGKFD